jgi:CRISPR-associated protein Cas5h
MKAINFELSGKTAFFKKPDVNVYTYFTYNNIHKPVLLGMLGAILGLGGHNQLFNKNKKIEEENRKPKGKNKKQRDYGFPEFYEKLKDLKVSIVPLTKNGYFSKKIQVFNNSIGYANQDGNLIVREQWLENSKWQILLLDDNSIEIKLFEKLVNFLLNSKTEFIPYLGKNDHPAKIEKVEILNMKKGDFNGKIASLFVNKDFILSSFPPRKEQGYFYKEVSPIRLKEKLHIYEYETLAYTNFEMKPVNFDVNNLIFSIENENYFFL